ncbi:tetratricopeptide repeat protein [Sphingorhabdus buctiana]|uniref:Tetratricopeptide repeat protein n=1 Tax=Sphingorhabdus buctiana TaxID=1508805 RepID=A0ABW4MBC7_9SPHN
MRRSNKRSRFIKLLNSIGIVRLLLVLVAGIGGSSLIFALTVSGVTRIKNPQLALMFVPTDSSALAARADQLLFSSLKKPAPEVRSFARAALIQQAINPKALRVLGYYADAQGDAVAAETLVRYSARLSRRETGAQLWLIEASARRNDTQQALKHYDIVLRTKPEVQSLLFPRLVSAIEEPEVRAALIPYIKNGSSWTIPFLFYANANSGNLNVVVDLVLESGGLADVDAAKSQILGLLERLVKAEQFTEARRLYMGLPGSNPTKLKSVEFSNSDRTGEFGAIGWLLVVDPDAGGQFIESNAGDRPRLAIFANASTTRTVASKLLYLSPGDYQFDARVTPIDRGYGGSIRWQLRCAAKRSGTEIWTFDVVDATARDALTIPSNCPVQFLDLIASGGNGQTGLEAIISSVRVIRIAG